MITKITGSSPLETLLRQSLDAIARTEAARAEASARLVAVLSRIASNFRLVEAIAVHSVIAPTAANLCLNGQVVRVPRLLVQCTRRDLPLTSPLTFVYTPIRPDCITLLIAFGNVTHRATDYIAWNADHGWHVPAYGNDIGIETHAKFLRAALLRAGLFARQVLSLEPMTP